MKTHTLLGAGQLVEFTLGIRGFVSRAAGIFGVGRMKADISSALHESIFLSRVEGRKR